MDGPATVVVSDAHLGAVPESNRRAFHEFLGHVPDLASDLLINGDLFDFWFEYRHVILRRHFRVLRRLAELVDAGVRIRLVGGNHDAWGGSFLRDEIGIELLHDSNVLRVGGRRALVAHGDGIGGGDWGYRALRRVIRSPLGARLFGWVHPDLGVWLAARVSGTAERQARGAAEDDFRAEHLSEHAARTLRENPDLDLVVYGHVHRPELREVEPGRFYVNPGDWIFHMTYAVVRRDELEIRQWPTSRIRAG